VTPKFTQSKSPKILQPQNSHLLCIYVCLNTRGLSCLKIAYTSRAYIHQYKNLKRKLYNCNASVYFNQKCLRNSMIPKFAKIIIPNTSLASKFIPFLYVRILGYNSDVLSKNTTRKFWQQKIGRQSPPRGLTT